MHNFTTILTDEITVQVYFDYEAGEAETHDCPSWPDEITLSTVLIDDDENKDVLFVLNDNAIEFMLAKCKQYLINQNEPEEH